MDGKVHFVYKKVAMVEQFFDIIYSVHVEAAGDTQIRGRAGKHCGQKRTYRAVSFFLAKLDELLATRKRRSRSRKKIRRVVIFLGICLIFWSRSRTDALLLQILWIWCNYLFFLIPGGRSIRLHPEGSHLKISTLLYWLPKEELSRVAWRWWRFRRGGRKTSKNECITTGSI